VVLVEGRFLVWANGIAAMVALSELIVQVVFAKQSNTVGWMVLLSDQVCVLQLRNTHFLGPLKVQSCRWPKGDVPNSVPHLKRHLYLSGE
jgi:hypothetical protein